ncbi:MAG: prolyl oligopeptidase family serine peptidase, partial [Bacteroidales bacterium]|nr:prolyl oligopeptidase family serine peptidase [Candidatus Cryptobacteroides aphodequi]
LTRYPKAGQSNPEVRIGVYSLDPKTITWADFDSSKDQYFGTPFWGDDSQQLFVQWMPRVQNTLELYAVKADDGSLQHIYHEHYDTWIDWMDDMLFASDGLYMARAFESGWQQIYYLSYDGKTFKCLTEGNNWRINLVRLDERKGEVYFTACRDSHLRRSLYKLAGNGRITRLSPLEYDVTEVAVADDFKSFTAKYSNATTPTLSIKARIGKDSYNITSREATPDKLPVVEFVSLAMADGLEVPAKVTYPYGFDAAKQYPVVMEIYGGPDTDYVRDRWRAPRPMEKWYAENGIIRVVADCRASGHNGRAGEDLSWRDVVSAPVEDFSRWAEYLGSLPYVQKERIGVEGFSFGGTMTTMLVMTRPDLFRCGVAGGGVYDWALYDTHYTERFMDTPGNNLEGYRRACALNYVEQYDPAKSWLKLTHGTGDDNVHFQNTLQLIDALQQAGKQFDLMIYPDGMHGYRGAQSLHDNEDDKRFWTEHLLND